MKTVFSFLLLSILMIAPQINSQNVYKNARQNMAVQALQNKAFEWVDEAYRTTFVPKHVYVPTTILNAASVGDSIDLKDGRIIGFEIPSTKSTGVLTFLTWSHIESKWVNYLLYDGTEVTYTPADSGTSSRIQSIPIDFAGIRYLKVRNGTSSVPVPVLGSNQVLGIIKRRY